MITWLFRFLIICIFLLSTVFAQELIETGFLRDHYGQPMTAILQMKYKIYTQATGGTPIWDSGFMTVSVNDGYYSVRLGSSPQPTLDSNVLVSSQNYYMGFEVDGDTFPSRELIAYHARAILADRSLRSDLSTTANSALHVDWSNISGVPTLNASNFKRGSGAFSAGETVINIVDDFCKSDTLVYLNVRGSLTPLGLWNVNSNDGLITILSDRVELNAIPFDYVMINKN